MIKNNQKSKLMIPRNKKAFYAFYAIAGISVIVLSVVL